MDKRQAVNPYLPSYEYVPDGEPHLFWSEKDGEMRVYVYGSHDAFGAPIFCVNDYVCWSAPEKDLTDWRYEGVIFRKKQDPQNPLGIRSLYAPDCVQGTDQQYRQSQENMDLINRKYHDLKHQLQVIRAENDSGRRLEYLDEMEDELRFFEAENHTGNAVLDTILTDKSRICVRQKIQMKVVADGKILNHMHVMDLATIFGNALDNAIEHEVQIEDPEKRMIRVSVSRKGMMACAVIENYFEGEIRKNGEEYLTTKADNKYHGYGLKSIRYAVEKYHGIFSAGVEDGWFRIRIMLPLENKDGT